MGIVYPLDVETTAPVLGEKHEQVGSFELHWEIGHLQNVRKFLFVEQLLFNVKDLYELWNRVFNLMMMLVNQLYLLTV